MAAIRAVLFDLDGTLLDSIPGILASFRHVLGRFRPAASYTDAELIMLIGEPVPAQMLYFSGGDPGLASAMADAYRAHNRGILPSMPLYPGAREALLAIRARGQPVGIVTSKGAASARISFEKHGLTPLLDLLLTADDTAKHKPDPEPLLVAARRLGLAPAEVAYVGDSVHDLRCARGAGCVAVAALWGPFEKATLMALEPDHAVGTLAELVALPALAPPA